VLGRGPPLLANVLRTLFRIGQRVVSHFAARRRPWRHKLTDRIEHDGELPIVLLLQLVQSAGQFPMRGQDFAQPTVRMISMFTAAARLLRRTLDNIATPCSVNAHGGVLRPPHELEMPNWHFKSVACAEIWEKHSIQLVSNGANNINVRLEYLFFQLYSSRHCRFLLDADRFQRR